MLLPTIPAPMITTFSVRAPLATRLIYQMDASRRNAGDE